MKILKKVLKITKEVSLIQIFFMGMYLVLLGMFFLIGIQENSFGDYMNDMGKTFLRNFMCSYSLLYVMFFLGIGIFCLKRYMWSVCNMLNGFVYLVLIFAGCSFEYKAVETILNVSSAILVISTLALSLIKKYRAKDDLSLEKSEGSSEKTEWEIKNDGENVS